MPEDKWGSGFEQVPCFADIESYGIKEGYANKMIWIKVKSINGRSPMATAAIQFMRLNLPGKAFPYSEPGDDVKIKDAVGMLVSIAPNFTNAVKGFEDATRKRNKCKTIDLAKSLVRLCNPNLKKFGGGLRVKKVEVFDNWQSMTTQTESSYGQTYDYSTTKLVNNITIPVSSGVATYEPALGKEENPFYQPIEYAEKMAALGPTDFTYIEEPLGESFFPSPSVGYSKVSVQTIHKTKKSANGIDVTEFYTAKDFPTMFENTPLDDDSKKPFRNPLGNFFKFDAKTYLTLSQGFKVELNDMHGKTKSQASFAQNNLLQPISYTLNYYKLDNDNALNKHLSNKVLIADSANGVITENEEMGKDIDIVVDVREQTSKTIAASVQLNIDIAKIAPPLIFPSIPRLPTFETMRYRSIAVTKVVNRYGLLDSVVHYDKGSKISTANLLYDGETGNVLLSRTQNEFDDPVYSFNYPGYWAYSGMEGAYKNIGAVFKDVSFLNGKLSYKGLASTELSRYFESGDELLLYGKFKPGKQPRCDPADFSGRPDTVLKIWAIDAAKANSGGTGIFFIDKDGVGITAIASSIKIFRSGKRNLLGTSVGAITSLKDPIKAVSGVKRLVFDSNGAVIATSAAKFKDFWKVDSSNYRKDTVMQGKSLATEICNYTAVANASFVMVSSKSSSLNSCRKYVGIENSDYFESYASSLGCKGHSDESGKTWIKFDFSGIPKGAIISSASLVVAPPDASRPQYDNRPNSDNKAIISRTTGPWIGLLYQGVGGSDRCTSNRRKVLEELFHNEGLATIDPTTQVEVPKSISPGTPFFNGGSFDVKNMVQGMLNDYYGSNKKLDPAMVIDMANYGECDDLGLNRMSFGFNKCSQSKVCKPYISICYIKPCGGNVAPTYLTSPKPGYYCYDNPIDTFVCKLNINDTAVNPYRWGIWGNWQMDRAYSYYNSRKQTDPSVATNIRKDAQ